MLAPLVVDGTTPDENALPDFMIGEGIATVGDALFVGGDVSAQQIAEGVFIKRGYIRVDATVENTPLIEDGPDGLVGANNMFSGMVFSFV